MQKKTPRWKKKCSIFQLAAQLLLPQVMESYFSGFFHQLRIVASSINQPKAARVCLFDKPIKFLYILVR